ncbi:unnamed protein product [Scytosiphon promiscuus]
MLVIRTSKAASANPAAAVAGGSNSNEKHSRDSAYLLGLPHSAAKLHIFVVKLIWHALTNMGGYVRMYLRDGVVLVKAGEILAHTEVSSVQDWCDWQVERQGLSRYFSSTDDNRPDHPPGLAPGKRWYFLGPGTTSDNHFVPLRDLGIVCSEGDAVIVLRERLRLPTHTLLHLVNSAHAVLVLRVLRDGAVYHYLHDEVVMSADEEELLMEWGLGRSVLANPGLALGGTVLVAFAERVWQPAVIGTLLVAAASYRAEGVLTKILRVRSSDWKSHKLVPSGIHGTERTGQLVLIVLVALADLLDDRVLLLTALTLASVHVIFVESVGQAVTTWGWRTYLQSVLPTFGMLIIFGICGAIFSWIIYVFAGTFSCILLCLTFLASLFRGVQGNSHLNRTWEVCSWIVVMGTVVVVGWVGSEDWKEADLKWSIPSLLPWRWCLTRAPDSFLGSLRLVGLWVGVVVVWLPFVHVLSKSVASSVRIDKTKPRGEKTRARKEKGVFCHYHESNIPSRHLLLPSADP